MKRIYLSQTDKKVAGIFGGIAEVYDLDPSLVRLLAVFLGVVTGFLPLLLTYLVGWAILPKGPRSSNPRFPPPE